MSVHAQLVLMELFRAQPANQAIYCSIFPVYLAALLLAIFRLAEAALLAHQTASVALLQSPVMLALPDITNIMAVA